jgi:hypothetical protein
MKRDAAADTAREALVWLAGQPEALERFMAETGADPADLRRRAAEPETLGFVLDFLLSSDRLVLAFSEDAGVAPDVPARARAALADGELPHWT